MAASTGVSSPSTARPEGVDDHENATIGNMAQILRELSMKNFQESYHDALQLKEEAMSLFRLGYLDLKGRALAESLFWAICDWGTMHPFAPRLQAMLEMLAHKDIALHPHAAGETLDQLAYHAPVWIVETHLERMEKLLADDPVHAADCWTDLTGIMTRRMAEAGRGDLAHRIAAIDAAVEKALEDEFP